MSVLLDEIGQWLVEQGLVGGSTGWTLYKGFMPPNPDQVICIFEIPGEEPDIVRDPSIGEKAYDKPGFQIRGRSAVNGYAALKAKMYAIFEGLHAHEPPVSLTSGEDYIYIYAKNSSPLPMGKDNNQRDEMSWNFITMRLR